MIEELGFYVIGPVLSTVTGGALLFTGRYFLKTGKILSDLEARVQNNEDDLEYVKKRINQISQRTSQMG